MKKELNHHPLGRLLTPNGIQGLRSGHPWLWAKNCQWSDTRGPEVKAIGEHWFLISPQSQIRGRRLGPSDRFWPLGQDASREDVQSPDEFLARFGEPLRVLVRRALASRKVWLQGLAKQVSVSEEPCRLIFSENDSLPGLILDRIGRVYVAQILTAPMEHFWPAMRPLLQSTITEVFDHSFLWIEDRRAPTREKEGLGVAPQVEGPLHEIPSSFDWNGLKWTLCLDDAQKTGLYLDQRDNHLRAAQMARDFGHRLAWDVCCFQGGFGLHLLKQGIPTEFVDASDRSLELVRGNVDLNSSLQGVAYKTHRADVFEWIRARYDSKDRADLIVLDPPSFSKSSSHREAALRGLKELNLRALHCLNNGGVLVSCVCSAAVSGEDLDSVVRQAAHDCRRSVKLLERRGPAFDHAPRLDFPEGDYLKAHFYRVEDNPRA